MELTTIFIGTIAIFLVVLLVKQIIGKASDKLCAICLAFSLTWIILLTLYYLKIFDNIIIISLLMGMTLLGIFYTIERNVKKELTVFRLPFLITIVLAGYYLLTFENILKEIILVIILWLLFIIAYIYRNNKKFSGIVNKVVECCKKW